MTTIIRKSQGKLLSVGFLLVGVIMLMQVVLPTISFQLWAWGQAMNNQILVSPIRPNEQVLGVSVENKDNFPAFVSSSAPTERIYDKFSLSVPKLKIQNVDVFVDNNDLSIGLSHLPGSALPGEKGNVFISGHSALRPAFSIKQAFFSNLTDLKKGDQIIINTPGSKFVYEVIGFKVVNPSDLSVIAAPEPTGRYVSLMTCVPPGLNFKRLVVLGKMI
ncbi:MAG: class E sortase [Candidatus Daviesbacteria bacterium]|nr:class E sortase [Candidatus Daviesbacteria bacterium]